MPQQPTTKATRFYRHRAQKTVKHAYIKEKIGSESGDAMNGTTVDQTKNSTESDKGQKKTSSGRGGYGDIRNGSNNIRDSASRTYKYDKGEIEAFGAMILLKHEKLELKKSFDVFMEKNYLYQKRVK